MVDREDWVAWWDEKLQLTCIFFERIKKRKKKKKGTRIYESTKIPSLCSPRKTASKPVNSGFGPF